MASAPTNYLGNWRTVLRESLRSLLSALCLAFFGVNPLGPTLDICYQVDEFPTYNNYSIINSFRILYEIQHVLKSFVYIGAKKRHKLYVL